jgi:hypothetical protein
MYSFSLCISCIWYGICNMMYIHLCILGCMHFVSYAFVRKSFSYIEIHGYPWVPTDQGPGGPCQVDPTCQKPCRPASGPNDLIHNPGDLGNHGQPYPDSGRPVGLVAQASPVDRGGGAATRFEDRGIPSVITEGDLPNLKPTLMRVHRP